MSEISEAQLADLGRLAVERCRKAYLLVAQLVEEDHQRAAILTVVASDFIKGASVLLEGAGMPEERACELAVTQVLTQLGVKFEKRIEK